MYTSLAVRGSRNVMNSYMEMKDVKAVPSRYRPWSSSSVTGLEAGPYVWVGDAKWSAIILRVLH